MAKLRIDASFLSAVEAFEASPALGRQAVAWFSLVAVKLRCHLQPKWLQRCPAEELQPCIKDLVQAGSASRPGPGAVSS